MATESKGETVLAYDTEGMRLGYDFVQKSYDWALNRLDAADDRLRFYIVTASALMVSVPTIYVVADEGSARFSLALAVALAIYSGLLIKGTRARVLGSAWILSPEVLYENYRTCTEVVFKNEVLRYAAVHFEANIGDVNKKVAAEKWLASMLGLLVVALAAWIVGF